MRFNKALRSILIVLFSALIISACSTAKKKSGPLENDVYTGTETVEYLANGVPTEYFLQQTNLVLLQLRETHWENKQLG